jgi:alkylation response protein AidB-like acyl-CoA dehydrogenase
MKLEPSEDHRMIAETFGRFFDEHSSIARVRAALPAGFDPALWRELGAMGALAMRASEAKGGMGLGLLEAALVCEQAGRTLASAPIAEAIVAARLVAELGRENAADLMARVAAGDIVVTLALHDAADEPRQWVAGGAVADAVVMLHGAEVSLRILQPGDRRGEPNLASTPMAELQLDEGERLILAQGEAARAAFLAGVEEWKLLTAATLCGLSLEALRLAAAYACERVQFGQPIGAYQGVSHPLADRLVEAEAGKLMVWRAISKLGAGEDDAGAHISLAYWWCARTATAVVSRALHTFGGYGLTTEYDIHLHHLRAKALPLVLGDPADELVEAGRRLWGEARAPLPDAGGVSIDFELGDSAEQLARRVADFFHAAISPERRNKAHYSFAGHDPNLHREMAQAGLLYPAWPVEYGGLGADPYENYAAIREWDRAHWTAHAQGTTNMIGQVIIRFGGERLKQEVLQPLAAGKKICSLGFSEPSSGSDVFSARTRAVCDGDEWVIDGQKMFTSGADLSDYVLLLARTDPDAPKHKGLTTFIVPLDAPGVEVQPVQTFQDEPTTITFYSGVRIPDAYRLGEVNGGLRVMAASLELEHGGSGFLYAHEELLKAAVEWAQRAVRRGRRAIEDEKVRTRLARVVANVSASELIMFRVLWAKAEKRPAPAYGPASKLFSSELFLQDGLDLLDLAAPDSLSKRQGPLAFINQCSRHGAATTIYGGTSEVHRSMVAEQALGLPRTRAGG